MNRRVYEALERGDGVLAQRDHPKLASSIKRMAAAGELVRVFPGVFTASGSGKGLRLRAACVWAPQGVLHAETAASFWLQEPMPELIRLAHPSPRRTTGIAVTIRAIPAEQVVRQGVFAVVSPAYSCAEVASADDGAALQRALRQRLVSVDEVMVAAATLRGTPGNIQRQRVLRAFERNPWSHAERRLHELLGRHRILGWVANRRIRIRGQVVCPDVLFEQEFLILEVDGFAYHSAAGDFSADRERQNLLQLAGYRVLRFTYDHVTQDPDYVMATIRAARAEPNR